MKWTQQHGHSWPEDSNSCEEFGCYPNADPSQVIPCWLTLALGLSTPTDVIYTYAVRHEGNSGGSTAVWTASMLYQFLILIIVAFLLLMWSLCLVCSALKQLVHLMPQQFVKLRHS